LKAILLHLPIKYIEALDSHVEDGKYPNRNEEIRMAIRDLLNDEGWGKKK